MNPIDRLDNKKRFENSKFAKTVNEKIEVGGQVKKLMMKYFKTELLGVKSKQPKLKPSPLGIEDFRDWQANTQKDPNSREDWALELMGNFSSYYEPIDVAYIQLGFNTYTEFDRFLDGLKTIENKKEAIYGGSYSGFLHGLRIIEKFRQMGIELYKLAMKYWKHKYGRTPAPIVKKKKKGKGIDFEDYKGYILNYKKAHPKRTSAKQFIRTLKKEFPIKIRDFLDLQDAFSHYIAGRFEARVFEQSKPLLGEVL